MFFYKTLVSQNTIFSIAGNFKITKYYHYEVSPPTELLSNQLRKDAHQLFLLYNEILEDINHPQLN